MQIQQLLSETNDFLARIHSLVESDIFGLQNVLREHNTLYYIKQGSVISDQEWDMLFQALKNLEQKYGHNNPESPTNRIDVLISSQFEKGIHASRMISLDNTYNEEDIADFEKRIRNVLKSDEALSYDMELKFD